MFWYSAARRSKRLSLVLGIMACTSGLGLFGVAKGGGDASVYWMWLTAVLLLVVFWCADMFIFCKQYDAA
jgi:lipopolysaccharide export LptBFGC system permease protein LptF